LAKSSADHHVRHSLSPRVPRSLELIRLRHLRISEPEAAAIHASTHATLHNLRPSMSFLLCDAGGGTVDTAVYKLIGDLSALEIAESCARTGSNCGSLFLDLRFEALVRSL
jgi:hypothetical protein